MAQWVTARCWLIVGRNLRLDRAEIDLLAQDPNGCMVIGEVKTRSARGHWPEERIDLRKKRTMITFARCIASSWSFRNLSFRFDAFAVECVPDHPPDVRHFPEAFRLGD